MDLKHTHRQPHTQTHTHTDRHTHISVYRVAPATKNIKEREQAMVELGFFDDLLDYQNQIGLLKLQNFWILLKFAEVISNKLLF